jgi:hypothetical protein
VNLVELAPRFTGVRFNPAKDAFFFRCPVCSGQALAAVAQGRITLTCPSGCQPDQIIVASFSTSNESPKQATAPLLNGNGPSEVGIPTPPQTSQSWEEPPQRAAAALPAPQNREYLIAHWQGQLLNVAKRLVGEVKTPEELADWIMMEAAKNGGPRQALQRPPDLKDLDDNECEGIYAVVAKKAWAERPQVPAIAPAGAGVPYEDREEPLKAHTLGELYTLYDEWERQPWIWDGILPSSSLSLIVGKSETGKSTIICGLIHAIAKGLNFFGRACRKGRVLYLAADPGSEFVAARTFRRLGLDPQDEVRTVIGALVGRRDGFAELRAIVADFQPLLIIADTLGATVPIDTDKYSQSYQSQQPLNQMARQYGLNCLCAHHSQKAALDTYSVIDAALGSVGVAAAASTRMGTKMYRRKGEKFFTFEMSSLRIGKPIDGEWVVRLNDNGLMELDRLWKTKNLELDTEQIVVLLERRGEPMAKRTLWQDLSPKPKWQPFNEAVEALVSKGTIIREKGQGRKGGGGWMFRLATREELNQGVNQQRNFDN